MQKQNDTIVVRKVNKTTYRRFRQKALERETNMGKAVTEAMEYWIGIEKGSENIDIRNLIKLNGLIKTSKKVKWSEQIDKTLYGERP
jgi:hypothetical protein